MRLRTYRGICSPTCYRENFPLTLFTERRGKEAAGGGEKPDRFSIISAGRKTIANDPRVYTGDLQTGYVLRGPECHGIRRVRKVKPK